MQEFITRLTLACAALLVFGNQSRADIVISISFAQDMLVSESAIVAGTATTDVFLRFDAIDGVRDDVGAEFDAFTYVVEADSSGGIEPSFVKPITLANLNSLMQSQAWIVRDDSENPFANPNQLAGNVNAPGDSGLKASFGGFVMAMTLETSQLINGDVVTINPNLFDSASVSNGSDVFGGNLEYVFNAGTLNVSAVPEPSSLAMIAVFGLTIVSRRRRCWSP